MTSTQWGLIMASPLMLGFLVIMWQVRKLLNTMIRVKSDEATRPGDDGG